MNPLLEVIIALSILGYLSASNMSSYLATIKRQVSQQIVASIKALDTALLNIDAQLHVVNTSYRIPLTTALATNDFRRAVCAATPWRYRYVYPYSDLINKGYLLLNYLDPRGNYFTLLKKYNASIVVTDSGTKLYAICLSIPDDTIRRQVLSGLGAMAYSAGGNTICYKFNEGGGYLVTNRYYRCP